MKVVAIVSLVTFLHHVYCTDQSESYQEVKLASNIVQNRGIFDKRFPDNRLIGIITHPFVLPVLPPITKDVEVTEALVEPKFDYLANPYSKYGFQYVPNVPKDIITLQNSNIGQGLVAVVGVNGTTSTINFTADEKIPEVAKIHTIGVARGGNGDWVNRRVLEAKERLNTLFTELNNKEQ